MTYRPEREKQGYCRIGYFNGKNQDIRRNEYDQLEAALRSGVVWYSAEDLYGDPLLIRLEEVVYIADCSPEAIAACDAEEDERKSYERTHGDA